MASWKFCDWWLERAKRNEAADLQAKLLEKAELHFEAQEERDRADEAYSTGMIMKSCEVERVEAERDAAIERGVCAIYYLEAHVELLGIVRQQLIDEHKRAEAAERAEGLRALLRQAWESMRATNTEHSPLVNNRMHDAYHAIDSYLGPPEAQEEED